MLLKKNELNLDCITSHIFFCDVNKAEPGSSDSIAITVWDGEGKLWVASKWNGVKIVGQTLDGSNLVVPLTHDAPDGTCVCGTDAAGNVAVPECILLAVYDPSAGFVTGGGWIMSPLNAYAADPSLTGKANFGFVFKYKKGATIPTADPTTAIGGGSIVIHAK